MRIPATPRLFVAALGIFLIACGKDESPTGVQTPRGPSTAADSAAFLAERNLRDLAASKRRLEEVRRRALEASAARIPSDCLPELAPGSGGLNGFIYVCVGDTVTVTVTSAECSGVGDVMYFAGVLTLVMSTDACFAAGTTRTIVSNARGPIWPILEDPRFGFGPFRIEGSLPEFKVYVEDGYGDGDFNDNILTIRIVHPTDCAPFPHDDDLEKPVVRDWINTEFLRGLVEGNEPNGWIYKNDATGEYVFRSDFTSPRTPCFVDLPPSVPVLPGHTPVAGYHGHILLPGTHPPASCGSQYPPSGTIENGPSMYDKDAAPRLNLKQFIIDEDQLHTVQRDGTARSQEWTSANRCRP